MANKEKINPSDTNSTGFKDRQERLPLQVLIHYEIDQKPVTMFCSNLSQGGVFIETSSPSPVGAKLRVNFSLPFEKNSFSIESTVMWVQNGKSKAGNPGMGLKFDELDQETKLKIDKAISYFQKLLGKKNG